MHSKKTYPYLLLIFWGMSLFSCGVKQRSSDLPSQTKLQTDLPKRIQHDSTFFSVGDNWLRKNEAGIWEMYISGNALERGFAIGKLQKELIHKQEKAFMDQVLAQAGSPQKANFLKKVIAWYNRKLPEYVQEEYKREIYGISRVNDTVYNKFAPAYLRSLYLHAAHDIGHALSDLMLVGCTSFAAWGNQTQDGNLLLGRNFDFYVGDRFNEEKIIAFIEPDNGHRFMMYTWPGFIGAVSGMNENGLTVTINAGKSSIPWKAKTPISLVTREILQYASTIEEAIAIAQKRAVFVSESIMVSSPSDAKAVLIEVSPDNFGVYEVQNTASHLSCSNHFQSEAYQTDKRNIAAKNESHSMARFLRMEQLLEKHSKLSYQQAAEILRDKRAVDEKSLGYGNELAINQLLAHHSIIFKPKSGLVWVSTQPYQLGTYLAYDLNAVFKQAPQQQQSLAIDSLSIAADPFLQTEAYHDYERFRKLKEVLKTSTAEEQDLDNSFLADFIQLNPDFWETHYLVGHYYYQRQNYQQAIIHFKQALKRPVTTTADEKMLKKYLKKSYRKL